MRTSVIIVVVFFAMLSCKKNQAGGKSSIAGTVAHHGKLIPFSRVFIKYGATEFPGTDTTKYDAKFFTGADAKYSFSLYKGNYYLYGYGFDTGLPGNVAGGVPYTLRNNENKKLEVPVTEL